MLRIQVNIKDVKRAPNSLSVSTICLASVVPGSGYSLVRVTPKEDHFYLYLPAVHDTKTSRDIACLLPSANPASAHWPEAAESCVRYERPSGTTSHGCVLHIIAYETVSNAQPEADVRKVKGDKDLGAWEQYATSANPEALKRLALDGLATVRIGQAKVSICDLALAIVKDGTGSVSVPLLDFSDVPMQRGNIQLDLQDIKSLIWNGKPVDRANQYLQTLDRQAWFFKVSQEGSAYNLEHYLALNEESQPTAKEYLNHYLRMFPRITGGDLDETAAGSLHFSHESGNVQLGGRLKAAIPRIVTTHAPIAYVDGDLVMPMHYYYRRPVNPDFITQYFHSNYLQAMLDSVCYHFGTTSDQLAQIINAYLDERPVKAHCSLEVLAALRIVVFFITHLNTTFRYRLDFSVGKGTVEKDGDYAVRMREDTSRDVDMGLNSEDCDGLNHAIHTIIYILWKGISGINNELLGRDVLFQVLMQSAAKLRETSLDFGSWPTAGLKAVQRLLFYYLPLSLMGLVVKSFPGGDSKTGAGIPQVFIRSLDHLSEASAEELAKLHYTSGEFPEMIAHAWSCMLPVQTVIDALVECIKHEDSGSGSKRLPSDQDLVDVLKDLHQTLSTDVLPLPILPPLMVEAVEPSNAFTMVGASAWLQEGEDRDNLRKIESKNRDLNRYNKNGDENAVVDDAVWYRCGVIHCEEGQLQWLPGDDPDRRASILYKILSTANIPLLNELFDVNAFTCSFVSSDGQEFGVDIEKVMGPKPSEFGLALPLHRIKADLRNKMNSFGDVVEKWRLPAQLCAYSSKNIQLPKELTSNVAQTFYPLSVFNRNLVVVNERIIKPEDLIEFEKLLNEKGDDIRKTREKLQPYGPPVLVYTYSPKFGREPE